MNAKHLPSLARAAACRLVPGAVLFVLHTAAVGGNLSEELKALPYRIVYESYRHDNWELIMVNADGSNPVNLTQTPGVHEIYPHVSPHGDRISFLVDEGEGTATVRSAYIMNRDGSQRRLIGKNIRWTCWSPDGKWIACLPGEPGPFSIRDGTTEGLFLFDPETGKRVRHPHQEIYHIYNICWTPDGNWFLATVHGGMGYRHTNLAIEARGNRVFDLGLRGCRPDVSPDGKRVAWNRGDYRLAMMDLDLNGPEPSASGQRTIVDSPEPMMVYQVDWSPDGRYVAFCRGPKRQGLGPAPPYLGIQAKGWNICVADATQENRWMAITTDGLSNKEPDWAPMPVASE